MSDKVLDLVIGNVTVNLDLIKKAESRVMEIASASPSQALELIAFFTDSLSELIDNIFDVQLAFMRSEVETERIKSLITLSLDNEGQKKASNADTRKAMVFTNPDFLSAIDKQNQLEATLAYLKEKRDILSKAYFGAKEIIAVNGGFNGERINA